MNVPVERLPPRLDVFDTALLDDPYALFAELRERGALCRAGPATWAVTRYAEVHALLRDPRLAHAVPEAADPTARLPGAPPSNDELRRVVSALDPPDHTRVRGLLARAVNPGLARDRLGPIGARVDDLLEVALERRGIDAVAELALPLQTAIACDLLGIPEGDRGAVSRQAVELGRAIVLIPFVTEERGSGEDQARWLRAYVAGLVADRRRAPRDDVVSALVHDAAEDDGLTERELVDNVVFLFFAGFESTVHLVAGACVALGRSPRELGRLRADPSLAATAVEEILRFDAPLQWVSRMTAAPVEVGGRTVRAGRLLLLLLASANRDERQFPHADRVDVGRHPNRHLSFGGGIHHCLGAALARAAGTAFLERLAARCASVETTGAPLVRPHPNVRGYARAPVRLNPA